MLQKIMEIHTDGSCKGNPGPGGWAAIIKEENVDEGVKILKGHAFDTTNNRMEMLAVIRALEYLEAMKKKSFQNVKIYSDSNLIIQTINQGWKRKANLDLWLKLDELNEKLMPKYFWVKGHAKNKWNNECDKIAVQESAIAQKKLFQSSARIQKKP